MRRYVLALLLSGLLLTGAALPLAGSGVVQLALNGNLIGEESRTHLKPLAFITEILGVTVDRDKEEIGEGEDGNSGVSRAVHQALTGRVDLRPGDEGFGAAVSERARQGNLGAAVSEPARSQNPGRGG